MEIKESKIKDTADTTPIKKKGWILPPPKSAVTDQKPFTMLPPNVHIEAPPTSIVFDSSPL
jgi:hypothetical protein